MEEQISNMARSAWESNIGAQTRLIELLKHLEDAIEKNRMQQLDLLKPQYLAAPPPLVPWGKPNTTVQARYRKMWFRYAGFQSETRFCFILILQAFFFRKSGGHRDEREIVLFTKTLHILPILPTLQEEKSCINICHFFTRIEDG